MPAPIDPDSASIKQLTNPTPSQIDEVAVVLRKAFAADPLTPIFTGNDNELDILLFKSGLESAAIGGALHVLFAPPSSAGETDRILGAAAWFPPGTSHNATPEQRTGWDTFVETAQRKDPKLRAWWIDHFIPQMKDVYDTLLPVNFTTDSWQLHLFGVLPEYHGKGLGKKLFNYAKAQAEATKTPIVLETGTDLDIFIYKRFGLEVVGDTKVENEYGQGKMTVMVKKWE